MANISIDIDLDEFDTEDLAEELYYRVERTRNATRATDKLLALVKLLHRQFFEDEDKDENALPVHSVLDQMKVEYMQQIFEKYTLTQIENALPL